MLVEPLELTTPIAAFNGGMFVQPDLTTVLEQRTLPLAVADEVVDYLLRAGPRRLGLPRRRLVHPRPRRAPRRARAGNRAVRADGDRRPARRARRRRQDRRRQRRSTRWSRAAEAELRAARRRRTRRRRVRSPTTSTSRTPMRTRAWSCALARACSSIPLEQIAAIGDMPNDVLMFGIAGMSIAMGNASPDVQRCARYVTTSNEEEGFANAVDAFVLGGTALRAQATLGLPAGTRACLFDLDGVLTQTARLHAAAWKQMFDDFLRERAARRGRAVRPVRRRSRLHALRRRQAARRRRALVPRLARHRAARGRRVRGAGRAQGRAPARAACASEHVETYDGLGALRARGARGRPAHGGRVVEQALRSEVLASAGIADLFDARIDGVVAAQQHLAGKPAPDTYLAAARALGVDPDAGGRVRGRARRRRGRAGGPLRLRGRRRPRGPGRRASPARRRRRGAPTSPRCWRPP